jgi:2-amino-4-hydroxy-6-hydroxymethyldihydropteridine diphosphokinase
LIRTLDVVVGLGSNLGDRGLHLRRAARELACTFELRACSPVYETAPVGPAQPDYLNAAVRLGAALLPDAILERLLAIERMGGRVRSMETRWGPRTIDLDILWIGGLLVATPTLTVPHPRLTERAFALLPLLDVAPDAIDPRTGARFAEPLPDPGVRRTSVLLKPEPA